MAKVKGRSNKSTELRLIKLFKKYGIKGWRRNYPLLGNPDFVFPKARLVIFVDGCFWHGCETHCRIPESNREYWADKINRNVKRDKRMTKEIQKKKWVVIRIWEHDLKSDNYIKILEKIKNLVEHDAHPNLGSPESAESGVGPS
jgi:DNA mismatch endonuclease (patch repair protein)